MFIKRGGLWTLSTLDFFKMEKEFNLSEKEDNLEAGDGWYNRKDIKEFIKRIKDFVGGATSTFKILDEINKLAGDKLTKWKQKKN